MKFERTEVFGLENALIGMRLPMSKNLKEAKSKCNFSLEENENATVYEFESDYTYNTFIVDKNTMRVAKNLCKADEKGGSQPNSKFLRMIHCQVAITAPQMFWAEFDTYKVGVTRNSSSLQHTGMKRDFVADDFECDCEGALDNILERINYYRKSYLETKDYKYFIIMRSLIPMSYKYTCMIDLDYATLRNIYHWRKNHKLPYWHEFCNWIETLPFSKELITGEEDLPVIQKETTSCLKEVWDITKVEKNETR